MEINSICSPVDKWVKKAQYTSMMVYYSALNEKEAAVYSIWMKPGDLRQVK